MIVTDRERKTDPDLFRELERESVIKRIAFRGYKEFSAKQDLGIGEEEAPKLMVFSYPGYLIADEIRRQTEKSQIIFYDPHQYGLILEFSFHNRFLKRPPISGENAWQGGWTDSMKSPTWMAFAWNGRPGPTDAQADRIWWFPWPCRSMPLTGSRRKPGMKGRHFIF